MCIRNSSTYSYCCHTTLSPNPVTRCEIAKRGCFALPCSQLADETKRESGICSTCLGELKWKMEKVRWMQEEGWVWTLREVQE